MQLPETATEAQLSEQLVQYLFEACRVIRDGLPEGVYFSVHEYDSDEKLLEYINQTVKERR